MPFKKQIEDETILEQFNRDDIPREGYTYAEISEDIDSVTPEAVRQRLVKLEQKGKVGSVKAGGVRFWHLPDNQVFVTDSAKFKDDDEISFRSKLLKWLK